MVPLKVTSLTYTLRFEAAAKGVDPVPVAQLEHTKTRLPNEEIVLAADKLISMDVKQRKETLKYLKNKHSNNEK